MFSFLHDNDQEQKILIIVNCFILCILKLYKVTVISFNDIHYILLGFTNKYQCMSFSTITFLEFPILNNMEVYEQISLVCEHVCICEQISD